jgi:DNA-binding transcriptional MerR regulator
MNINEETGGAMVTGGKTYYSISEVGGQMGVEPHVLRYWESEFPQLRPKKNRAGNRAYRDRDIDIIRTIKHLLYEEGYTIPGAKRKLASSRSRSAEAGQASVAGLDPGTPDKSGITAVKKELKEILSLLTR